jgi:hypothetical protein
MSINSIHRVFLYCVAFVYSFPKISTKQKRHISAPSYIPSPKWALRELSIIDQVELIKDSETLPRPLNKESAIFTEGGGGGALLKINYVR